MQHIQLKTEIPGPRSRNLMVQRQEYGAGQLEEALEVFTDTIQELEGMVSIG